MVMLEIQVMIDESWNTPTRAPQIVIQKIQESGRLVRARCCCCRSAWVLLQTGMSYLPGPLCKGCKAEAPTA